MLKSIKLNNCYVFNKSVDFSMKADLRTKKFGCNIFSDEHNLLKTAVIYGGNNSGKTSFVKCLKNICNTLLNNDNNIRNNLFGDNDISELSINFIVNNTEYNYCFNINTKSSKYVYEQFSRIEYDAYGNGKMVNYFTIDRKYNKFECCDDDLKKLLPLVSDENILIYVIDVTKFQMLNEVKDVLVNFANNLVILDTDTIQLSKTIDILKNKDNLSNKVAEFILKCDIYLDGIALLDYDQLLNIYGIENNEKNEQFNPSLIEQLRLVSIYKDRKVPSIFFDSKGTIKIISLASYILEALEDGKTLIIDELDGSLHFKIVREIISLFNNELNRKAQLIATVHDVSLLDCKYIFRKEQIWFIDRINEKGNYDTTLYSLAKYNCNDDGIRSNTDLLDKLSKGLLGAVPDPDLISWLIDINVD